MDGLIDLGQRLTTIVKKLVGSQSQRHLVVRDPTTAGILAVGTFTPRSNLGEGTVLGSYCVTGGDPGIGFDAHDIWDTSSQRSDQSILVIATSADGVAPGLFTVKSEY
jgi:hypothetical protein